MERFAFKIDAALKANLYKICRLCGIDNPGKVQILPQNEDDIIDLDEPSLSQKVYELVGFMVSGDDKMPQTMCSLCVDKINDFYEFREMCYATNKQTRNLLGLKAVEPEKLIKLKPIIKSEPQLMGPGGKRGRKRKTEDNWPRSNLNVKAQVKKEPVGFHKKLRLQPAQSAPIEPKTEPDIKEEPVEPETSHKVPPKKGRKSICSVCGEKFLSKELADEHKSLVHVPSILRYVCNACNQTHHNHSDIRAHQLWHKLSKTPYKCPLCETSVANAYAFTRHLREHNPPTPVQLLVLDRECPLCKKTFITNFFYNTHRCAIRKRKCGGCSRALNSEAAYMRHAPTCAKIYLTHSKHIMPEVVTNEAQMRIMNEVEDELVGLPPATTVPPDFVIDEGMQPVVVLERLSSPLLRASGAVNRLGASKGRNSERVSAKKYLKRVDQLLKNTMSTLVSIKHEPEMHISDTGPTGEHVEPEPERTEEDPPSFGDDDFHGGNDDSDEEENPMATSSKTAALASDNVPSLSIKQELLDEAYEKQMEVKQEPLKLKLKITKNHGKLNSSIIDDLDEAGPATGRSSKKKKKRKHKEREKEASVEADVIQDQSMVNVKQEPADNDYVPQATVMTTIPITQLESSYNESEQHEAEEPVQIQEDVKPNRVELDRMMQISHVASGVDMAEEAMPLEREEEQAVEATPDEPEREAEKPKESPPKTKVTSVKSTARKSTGGVQRKPRNETPKEVPLPQIVAVESGEAASFNMIQDINIKPEPRNRGYGDDEPDATEEINHNEKMDEENDYIDSLDLNNVTVKQEKDLDISHESETMHCNGLEKGGESEGDDDGHEDSISSADEAEEAMEEDEEERIYQEIELPPLEAQTDEDKASQSVPEEPVLPASKPESEQPPLKPAPDSARKPVPALSLVITNICSQAAPDIVTVPDESLTTSDLEPIHDNTPASTSESQPTLGPVDIPAPEANEIQSSPFNAAVPVVETQTDIENNQSAECLNAHSSNLVDEHPSEEVLKPQIEVVSNMTVEDQSRTGCEANSSPIESQTEGDMGSIQPMESLAPPGSAVEELPAPIEDRFPADPQAHSSLLESQPVTIHEVESLPSSSSNIQEAGSASSENISSTHINPALESLDSDHDTATTPMVSLNGPKDIEAQALPVYEAPNFTCDEEQQNVLNHEISEQQQAPLDDGQRMVFEEQPEPLETGQEPSQNEEEECKPGTSTRPIEETENRINEQQQQQGLALEDQRQPRCQANNDDSNINEIAENNNNANIERELQDDTLGGAQEDDNP
ncbi:titin [Drosophila serrata]|uniref:titin n=1 Tax=Drosophila serrata TaxID=7274 RepID=UPI000A1D2995|nr:titin [Drosophila serrata]